MKQIIEQLKNEEPAVNGEMKTARVVLALHRDHSVAKTNITPAELQLLVVLHATNAKGEPVLSVEETGTVKIARHQEVSRLRSIYGNAAVKAVFGPNSALPETFRDAIATGFAWAMENPLEEGPLVGRRLTSEEANAIA